MAGNVLALLLLAAATTVISPKQTRQPSDVRFFREYQYRSVTMNPAGTLIAAITTEDAIHEAVTIIDLQHELAANVFKTGGSATSLGRPQWISDDTLIFTSYTRKASSLTYSAHWKGEINGVPAADVTQWRSDAFLVDPMIDDGDVALIATVPIVNDGTPSAVYRVHVNAKNDEFTHNNRVAQLQGRVFQWLSDRHGHIRLAGEISKKMGVQYLYLDPSTDKWLVIRTLKPDETFVPVAFTAGGDSFLVLSNSGHDKIGVYTYDLQKRQITNAVFADSAIDIANALYDPYHDRVIGVSWYMNGAEHFKLFDNAQADYQKSLELTFPHQRVQVLSRSRDGARSVILVSSARNPGTYYQFDAKAWKSTKVGDRAPWLDPAKMGNTIAGSVKSREGFRLDYLLTLPVERKSPYPLVVMPHGGPLGVMDTLDFDPGVQYLAVHGFAVLRVNYRGSGGYGKRFLDAGKRQWGRKIEDDIDAVVDDVLGLYPLDPERICAYGASYGGYSALMSAIRHPARYRCAASFAGVTDIPLLFDTSDLAADDWLRQEMIDIAGNPKTDADRLYAISPVYLAKKLERPVFIAQGDADDRVDEEQAYRLKAVLDRLHKPYEFRIYKGEGHGFDNAEDQADFYSRLVRFLDANIGGKPPSASVGAGNATPHQP